MATTAYRAGAPSRGMSLGELAGDTLRSPLAQAFGLAVALGMFLLAFGPTLGLRDTFRGASLGFRPAPDFALQDQAGRPVALGDLGGGPVVLTFIHSRCTLACPLTASSVGQAMALLGKDASTVSLVGITVDPAHDGPAELRAFAERYRLSPDWRLLSGSIAEVTPVLVAYHAEPYTLPLQSEPGHQHGSAASPSEELLHPTMVLLIDAQANLRFAYGPGFAPEDLAHDIRLMQRDMGGPSVPFPLY